MSIDVETVDVDVCSIRSSLDCAGGEVWKFEHLFWRFDFPILLAAYGHFMYQPSGKIDNPNG